MPIMEILQLSLVGICLWSLWQGGGPERIGAALLLLAYFIKVVLTALGQPVDYFGPNLAYLLLTSVFFLLTLLLAIQSNRVWPLFFSAFWLVEVTGHLSAFVIQFGMSRAFWGMTQGPIILQTVILGFGSLAYFLRRTRGIRARDWRIPFSPQERHA